MKDYFFVEYSDSRGPQTFIASTNASAIHFVSGILSASERDSRKISKILILNTHTETMQALEPFIDETMKLNFREVKREPRMYPFWSIYQPNDTPLHPETEYLAWIAPEGWQYSEGESGRVEIIRAYERPAKGIKCVIDRNAQMHAYEDIRLLASIPVPSKADYL